MAPISLVLLNPLGFLCMEVGERLRESRRLAQKIIPIQQADASTGSDNQLSRKVSTSSSGSLSSSNHSRSHANRCKVYQPKIKKTKKQFRYLQIDNLVSKIPMPPDILDCLEKYVVYSDCCNDRHGYRCQLSLRSPNTGHSKKPVRGNQTLFSKCDVPLRF